MLTPDEIKKLIEITKPEGFIGHEKSCSSYTIEYLKSAFEIEYDTLKGSANREVYELFLQRCIEGITRHNIGSYIIQRQDSVEACCDNGNWSDFLINGYGLASIYNVDQAKEEALRYILEELEK